MRVILASAFVFFGVFAVVGVVSAFTPDDRMSRVVLSIGPAIAFLLFIVAAMYLFNPKGSDPFGQKTQAQRLRQLEADGLLVSADFQARRAFGVAEYEDEGLHYFLELLDGRVLYLSGQYLYDYEPALEDADENAPRRFPCTEFTIRRHKTDGYVVELICRGVVLEPECFAPPFARRDFASGQVPEDGQIMSDRPYDALKASRWTADTGRGN